MNGYDATMNAPAKHTAGKGRLRKITVLAIIAYSIAVAPASSLINRNTTFFISEASFCIAISHTSTGTTVRR